MTDPGSNPIPLRIRLPYGSEDEFIERYGTNVARGGIFIATRSIKPEGTLLQFEFVLGDGTRLLRGEGLVVKTQIDEGGGRSGMTVRFTRLDARSKALVDRVIAHRSGTADAEPPPPVSSAPSDEPLTSAPELSESEAAPTEPESPPVEASAKPVPRAVEPTGPARLVARRISLPETPAVQPLVDEVVLGVDLGTTNSRAAIYVDGEARLVPLTSDGKNHSIPSVVAVDEKDRFLVGIRAKAQILIADCYWKGRGLAKNQIEAYVWAAQAREIAKNQDKKKADSLYDDIKSGMNGDQIKAAEIELMAVNPKKKKDADGAGDSDTTD